MSNQAMVESSTLDDHAQQACERQFLTFRVGREMFALRIREVREILNYGGLSTVPLMPDFVRGVINLRGSVVPVIDLAARFDRGTCEAGKRTCIVILELTGQQDGLTRLGLVVDSVSEVIDIDPQLIEPAPRFGSKLRQEFIEGIGKLEEMFVILLNASKVVDVEEMSELAALANEAPPALEAG